MSTKEINRQVLYPNAPVFLPEDKTGVNNRWIYVRAPEGYLFQLIAITISTSYASSNYGGIFMLADGHEYTHWNIYPGVENRECLFRAEMSNYNILVEGSLHGWECKEYTLACRSTNETYPLKAEAVIWYYLKKASRTELLEYALKHPIRQDTFKRALRGTTVEPEET